MSRPCPTLHDDFGRMHAMPTREDPNDDASHGFEIATEEGESLFWMQRLAWLAFVLLAAVVFELTIDPVLASAVLCLKFAFGDCFVAVRLLVDDPRVSRGLACCFGYLGYGAAKATVVGGLAGLGVMVVVHTFWPGRFPFRSPMLTVTAGVCALTAAFCSVAAFILAAVGGFRLWISNGILESLAVDKWPPRPQSSRNDAGALAVFASFSVLVLAYIVILVIVAGLRWRVREELVMFIALAGVLLIGSLIYRLTTSRLIAASPAECWPEEPEDVYDPKTK